MTTEIIIQVLANGIALASAIAAFLSARASREAATETRLAARATLTNAILDSYGSPEVLGAVISLRAWVSKHGTRSPEEFRRLRVDDYELIRDLDQARRRVSQLFKRIYTLYTLGFLDESAVRAVVSRGQVAFFREVVEPLEAAIATDYDRASFDGLGALYGIGPSHPPMAGP
jgi:hypothetical protein